MGQAISKIANEKGYTIIQSASSRKPGNTLDLTNTDIVIDFSTPTTAFDNIKYAITNNTPVVSGTTGWLKNINQIKELCLKKNGSFLYSANFSIGMNLFFKLNKTLAKIIKEYNYKSSLYETHHLKKIDKPSGTAKILAKDIEKISGVQPSINSERKKDIIGIHKIAYQSKIDTIEITHHANSRDGFAIGAILAAEWLVKKKGVFNFEDLFVI